MVMNLENSDWVGIWLTKEGWFYWPIMLAYYYIACYNLDIIIGYHSKGVKVQFWINFKFSNLSFEGKTISFFHKLHMFIHLKEWTILITKISQVISQIQSTIILWKFTCVNLGLTFGRLLTFRPNSWPKLTDYSKKPWFSFFSFMHESFHLAIWHDIVPWFDSTSWSSLHGKLYCANL